MRKLAVISGVLVVMLVSASFKYAERTPVPDPVPGSTISTLQLTLAVSSAIPLAEYADAH